MPYLIFHGGMIRMRRAVSKNILIIDDDDDLRDIIHYALVDQGHNVRSFQSPENALTILSNGDFDPDLIIVDQYMKKITGGEFLEIKQNFQSSKIKNCPSIIISGSPQEVEKNVARNLYTEIIPKPLDMDQIVERIGELFSDLPERALE
jgi:DNA-binding NtrC family response regulator